MRRRLTVVGVLAVALLLLSPIGATELDEDFEPPAGKARRGSRSQSERSGGASSETSDDPQTSLATAKGGSNRVVEEVTFVLEHSLEVIAGEATGFEPAGVFSAKAHFTRDHSSDENDASQNSAVRLSHLKLTRDELTQEFIEKFNYLTEHDLPYRIALPANVLHPQKDEKVIAFLPARCLSEVNLQENFALHMDENANVVGIDYDPAGGECAREDSTAVPLGDGSYFKTTSSVRFYKTAPTLDPDAPTDVRGHGGPAGKKEREAKQRRESSSGDGKKQEEPEKTFLQKNWMYLVPVMMLLSNLIAPPPQQGGGRANQS